ncbi:hypothetical protein HBI66_057790 [Parastagonospora nodorum]|nr:hypothetical protein HBI66_057790 [Parastagonospora nodorum]
MATTKAQAVADMRAFADADNPLEEITQANQIKSPLLELPAEIRGIIYEYFFCDLIVRVNTNEPRLKRLAAKRLMKGFKAVGRAFSRSIS